mmetsp:Transcript_2737/g.4820  ORF Transcript_2737/g.4820 Transcript_2737/m.4820 type:complete len:284 (+) Transcript_2737:58-909(+)
MYYVCKGCSDCVEGGCTACSKGCQGVQTACDSVCQGLGTCLGSVCVPCAVIWSRPLGMYVVLCWAFNLPALIASVYSLVQEEDCTVRNLKALLLGNAIFSFLHAGFALYLQTRLFHGLQKAAEGLSQPPTAKDQMKRAWDIILYDFGFLFYLFVFFGSFGFNCYASGWAFSCGANFLAFLPSLLLILFFLAAMQFAVLWFFVLSCTDCCQGSPIARVVLGVKPSHPSQAAPPTLCTFQHNLRSLSKPYTCRPPLQQPQAIHLLGRKNQVRANRQLKQLLLGQP